MKKINKIIILSFIIAAIGTTSITVFAQNANQASVDSETVSPIITQSADDVQTKQNCGIGKNLGLLKEERDSIREQLTKIVADLTGKTVEEIKEEKAPLGKIAKDADKLEEFKTAKLDVHKTFLDKKVADGTITQQQADEYIEKLQEKLENCDGAGKGASKIKGKHGENCQNDASTNSKSFRKGRSNKGNMDCSNQATA